VQHNVRRILAVMENWISETPDQWLMYHRVWPETDGRLSDSGIKPGIEAP